jgi:hypothetical protein
VETLLLRWVLSDRTVSLEEVLRGAPASPAPAGGSEPSRPRAVSTVQQATPASPPPAATSAPVRAEFTLEGLLGAWNDLVAAARSRSRFLGEALASARPLSVTPPEIRLTVTDGHAIHAEALGRQREAVEKLLGEAVGAPVRVALVDQVATNPPQRARRLTESESRAERLKVLKGRDPALEAAAEVLDLEVLE